MFKKRQENVQIVRIAKQEWTTDDMGKASFFVKSPVFKKMKAWADETIFNKVVNEGASDDFRKGWMACQSLYEAYGNANPQLDDSIESTAMQFED